MDPYAELDEIVEQLRRLGVEVRSERLGGDGGGACVIRGTPVVFVDSDADIATRITRCVEALAAQPSVDSLYLPPALRERVDRLRG
jgi:hypothetical protein